MRSELRHAPRMPRGLPRLHLGAGWRRCERAVERGDVLGTGLGVQVALGRAEPRVPEECLDEVRAGLACNERPGRMAQRVKTQRPQARRVAGARVAAPYGGAV